MSRASPLSNIADGIAPGAISVHIAPRRGMPGQPYSRETHRHG